MMVFLWRQVTTKGLWSHSLHFYALFQVLPCIPGVCSPGLQIFYTWVTSNSDRNLVIAIEVHALAHGHQQLGTGGIEEAVEPWPAGW